MHCTVEGWAQVGHTLHTVSLMTYDVVAANWFVGPARHQPHLSCSSFASRHPSFKTISKMTETINTKNHTMYLSKLSGKVNRRFALQPVQKYKKYR